MNKQNIDPIFDNEWFQNLRNFLRSETTINQEKEQGFSEIIVKVKNCAPASYDGINVVFIGVGLRIINGLDQVDSVRKQTSFTTETERHSVNSDLCNKYERGEWVSGEVFPAITDNEATFGEYLFPGDSVTYTLQVPYENIPYLGIRVEGQVSRRHLFHFTYPVEKLKPVTHPSIKETLQELDKIDIFQMLKNTIESSPQLGPQTTLADLEKNKNKVNNALTLCRESMKKLNDIFHSTHSPDLKIFMKQCVGQYITSAIKSCESAEKALSSGDTQQMQNAIEALKIKINDWKEVEEKKKEIKVYFKNYY